MNAEAQQDGATGRSRKRGSALVCTEVLLGNASLGLGSVMFVTLSYLNVARKAYHRDRSFYLAEAGLSAAMVKMNAYQDANISWNESRSYFGDTSRFDSPDWGFKTQLTVDTNGQSRVVSTGRFRGESSEVAATVSLVGGERSIHALFAHALYAGNSSGNTNYLLRIGGSGNGADFVAGDTYSGNDIELTGSAKLRHPELLDDLDNNGVCSEGEEWEEALVLQTFAEPLSQSEFDDYVNSMSAYMDEVYNNGIYDYGEAYVDTIGNGIYEEGEPFTDENDNGVRDPGDEFTDENGNGYWDPGEPFVDQGNGVWDSGEEWIEDEEHTNRRGKKLRVNGRYDQAGGYWKKKRGTWRFYRRSWTADWPAESFEDEPDGVYEGGEPFVDGNGVYDEGEEYLDDRNALYDYGTQATGDIDGMPAPGNGQQVADGGDAAIEPPDLQHMYYHMDKDGNVPFDALARWGHDISVTANDYGGEECITDTSRGEHIFVRNPPTSGSTYSRGKRIRGRTYSQIYDDYGQRVDDYFFEDPTDPTYDSYVMDESIDGTRYTAPMFVDVRPEHNVQLYYVEGNVYLHNVRVYCMRFRRPGTRITIVAKGNITISDEFYYNADYDPNLDREDVNSTIVNNPSDALCLIALKNPDCADSGNIRIGDAQFGTGGAIHAMLYAENTFVDNNLNTANQPFISVFGNMTAGDHVSIMRSGSNRTRLDITLDERIRNGEVIVPGLPHPVGQQRRIILDTEWAAVAGTWSGCTCRLCQGL